MWCWCCGILLESGLNGISETKICWERCYTLKLHDTQHEWLQWMLLQITEFLYDGKDLKFPKLMLL